MTCIVGLLHGGSVTIGSDSMVCDGLEATDLRAGKVHAVTKRNGSFLIGFCGELRYCQIVQHTVVWPTLPGRTADLSSWAVRSVFPAIAKALKRADHKLDDHSDSRILIGARGQLLSMSDDGSVVQSARSYTAIGSGQQAALGALSILTELPGLEPVDIVTRALGASERHTESVRRPFHIKTV